MAGILDEIRSWARGLKYWEQATLEKILSRPELNDDDYGELLGFWEQDAGLAPVAAPRPEPHFPGGSSRTASRPRVRLLRLYNLSDVNALPQGQDLPFGPQLTLIFGANGAGKTGYARPLGAAAFTRGTREVLPNMEHGEDEAAAEPTADIDVSIEGHGEPVSVHWRLGHECPELSGFYVFNAESLRPHLVGPNPMAIIPSALGILTKLADETDQVRRRVRTEIERRTEPPNFSAHFQGNSSVTVALSALGPGTDILRLRELATLTPEEEANIGKLETEIAQLRLRTNAQRLIAKRRELSDLGGLISNADRVAKATDQESETHTRSLIQTFRDCKLSSEQFGADYFAVEGLSQVGSGLWRQFIAAARALAEAEERANSADYPREGVPCLLCQQSLSGEAVGHIRRLWEHLASDSQKRLEEARLSCFGEADRLERLPLDYIADGSSVRRFLGENLSDGIAALDAHAESAVARVNELVGSLRAGELRQLPPLIPFDSADILHLASVIQGEIRALEGSKDGERLAECQASLRGLEHRRALSSCLPAVEDYVRGRRWASRAQDELGTTAGITRKYNELFESLVTDRYKATFQSLLRQFGRNLRVTVETVGRKGQTVRQIALTPEDFPSRPSISSVLSDGEKRAVALADFLAEAETDDPCDGLVLDDPVTSFDAGWKKGLARYLCQQASAGRQVVLFTHDLAFLYDVHRGATELGVAESTHWIQKIEGKPGFLFVNNSPATERDFRTARYANELWLKSKDLGPVEQQRAIEQGFGALRTSYEALVIFHLFEGVVERFEERLRLDNLARVNFDSELARRISEGWGRVSRFIDAHLRSDRYAAEKPTREDLRREINAFDELRARVRGAKKEGQGV